MAHLLKDCWQKVPVPNGYFHNYQTVSRVNVAFAVPIACMVYLPTYIYYKIQPNVGKYSIQGFHGVCFRFVSLPFVALSIFVASNFLGALYTIKYPERFNLYFISTTRKEHDPLCTTAQLKNQAMDSRCLQTFFFQFITLPPPFICSPPPVSGTWRMGPHLVSG